MHVSLHDAEYLGIRCKPAHGIHAAFVLDDEFDLHAQRGARICTHALLLSAGLELHIRFANLPVRRFGHVRLANSKPLGIAREWAAANLLATTWPGDRVRIPNVTGFIHASR